MPRTANKSPFNTTSLERMQRVRSPKRSTDGWLSQLLPNQGGGGGGRALSLSRRPLVLIVVAACLLLGVFVWQLINLQIVNGQRYAGLAEGNRLRRKVTYAQRGRILDRNGVELVSNQASFQLVASPYNLDKDPNTRQAHYQQLSSILKLPTEQIQQKAEAKGLDYGQPLLVAENISYQDALLAEQKLPGLPGFSLDAVPTRQYKSDAALANVLGYVGRVNEDELAGNSQLLPVDFIGKDGIEAQYDSTLRGQNGVVEIEVDSLGRPVRTITERPTKAGQDIRLSIDYGLQQQLAASIAEQMQRAGAKRAAGVAMHPLTGEVLAMVSLPSYDNNLFSQGISPEQYNSLINDANEPLVNKTIAGVYPSGSIIKPMHLAGALQEKVVNENTTFVDNGAISVPSVYDPSIIYTFKGWNPNGLGAMNARRAIAMSSDIYFYTVGGGYQGFKGLGVERLTDYYRKFGLGDATGVDLPGEASGRVPTPEWKKQTKGEDWFIGDTYNISIGQGDILTSPLQMAVAESAVVNGNKILQPRVLLPTEQEAQNPTVVRQGFVDEPNLKIVREGMKQVIGGTTATSTFAGVRVPVAGKSGTAETDPDKKKPHAWYVAFAPYENPNIMFSVILEGGEGGSQFAAPAIAKAMQWYFNQPQHQN